MNETSNGLSNENHNLQNQDLVGTEDRLNSISAPGKSTDQPTGSSIQESNFSEALNQIVDVESIQRLDASKVGKVDATTKFSDRLGENGDFLDPAGGNNTIFGSGDSDVILGHGGGMNTITTGTGQDTIVLGNGTTNRISDFDLSNDEIVFGNRLDISNLAFAQGKGPEEGNAVIFDQLTKKILVSLEDVDSTSLAKQNFQQLSTKAVDALEDRKFNTKKQGNGEVIGTQGQDKLVGGKGDDILQAEPEVSSNSDNCQR